MFRSRRRPRYGAQLCALTAAVLLLLSVSLLYGRISTDRPHRDPHTDSNPFIDGTGRGQRTHANTLANAEDRIDDDVDDGRTVTGNDDTAFRRNGSSESDEDDVDDGKGQGDFDKSRVSGYFFDHMKGVIRRAFGKRSIIDWEDYVPFDSNSGSSDSKPIVAFGSDDIPLDENVREKMGEVRNIEDLLLLKNSPLRERWGEWFDKKGDFLRRDRMFKSNIELLNPMNNPLLQDPDGAGSSGLTRGDKLLLKGLLNEFKKAPFLAKKPSGIVESSFESKPKSHSEIIKTGVTNVHPKMRIGNSGEDRNVDENLDVIESSRIHEKSGKDKRTILESKTGESRNQVAHDDIKSDLPGQIYADGKRWGYFPGLHPDLTFSNFINSFFRNRRCTTRVFMVWNSPAWMFGVRHQRALESLLYHNPDACIVVFSETIELSFFHGFVKEGFKVAVAMPNLDELLRDTPVHVFASFWFEWKKTKHYPTHYSELVRLVTLYKYGGMYLDFDIIVLKQLVSLYNSVGLEDEQRGSPLNGAVMVFRKHSPFMKECLEELYSTYDDTCLRCNGGDLLTRVAWKFLSNNGSSDSQKEVMVQSPSVFFPISWSNITRFFTAPATEGEIAEQDALYAKILNQSFTFHFWNSLTSNLVPEPQSLVARLINQACIRCYDVL